MTDRQRFDDFIVQHLDNARRLAEIYVKNPDDAEDVVAESIEKALRNVHAFKETYSLNKKWFNLIVINTAIDHLRKQSKRNVMNKVEVVYHYDDFSRLNIEDLLDALPERDRQIVTLRFIDNCELKEIAETLEMNENTVKTRLYRSLKKLQLELNDEGYNVNVKKDRVAVKAFGIGIIAVLLSATLIFNLSSTLAAAAYDIPILGDIVRVITFNRFEYADKGYNAEILVPEIQGLLNPELQDRLNTEFREYADDLIRSFESTILEVEEFGEEPVRMSIKADYAIRTDNDRVLSLDTWIYSDINGFVLHKFYTLDKSSERQIELRDLFKPDTDYVTPISEYLVTEMIRLNAEENKVYFVEGSDFEGDHFTTVRSDNGFYINDEGRLVICFDKHEVGAGFMGSPEFVIPSEVIEDISGSELLSW